MKWHALWSVLLCACAARAATPGGTGSSFPAAHSDDTQPADLDVGAWGGLQADLQHAITLVYKGDPAATAALQAIADQPAHPYRNVALTLLARQALQQGGPETALALTSGRSDIADLAEDASLRFFEAAALAHLGHGQAALDRLARWQNTGPPVVPGLSSEELTLTWQAAQALANGTAGRYEDALLAWQAYHDAGNTAERLFAVRQAETLAARIAPEMALDLYQRTNGAVPRLALGPRARTALLAQGKQNDVQDIDRALESLRARLSSGDNAPPPPSGLGSGDPSRLGLVVPLSGAALPLGVAAARGAMVAIGPAPAAGSVPAYQVVLRDSGKGHGGSAQTAHDLAREDAVIGVVGMADPATIDQMGRDGVPYLVLGDQVPGGHTTAFQLIHAPQARINALVEKAAQRGARRFAVFRPNDTRSAEAACIFTQTVSARGFSVAHEVVFPSGATTFSKEVDLLKRERFDALFVPEDADRLELVAPALAVADLWPHSQPGLVTGKEQPTRGNPERRRILLLSTARGLSGRLLKKAGRYVQGTLLAPGFFADEDGPSSSRFVNIFRELYGRDPSASDAFGFDGIHILRNCVDRGARTRADVLRLLSDGEYQGVTGRIRFGPDHARTDPALVYEVVGDRIRAVP